MATFQANPNFHPTLDKQIIFDYLKNLATDPEKFTMNNVDEMLKAGWWQFGGQGGHGGQGLEGRGGGKGDREGIKT